MVNKQICGLWPMKLHMSLLKRGEVFIGGPSDNDSTKSNNLLAKLSLDPHQVLLDRDLDVYESTAYQHQLSVEGTSGGFPLETSMVVVVTSVTDHYITAASNNPLK